MPTVEAYAIDLGPISVGSQTTWTTQTDNNYFFNTQRILCGNNNEPLYADEVYAGR